MQIARGLILGGLISFLRRTRFLKYSLFDAFISKTFSKKRRRRYSSKLHTDTVYYEAFNLPLGFPVASPTVSQWTNQWTAEK